MTTLEYMRQQATYYARHAEEAYRSDAPDTAREHREKAKFYEAAVRALMAANSDRPLLTTRSA